MRSVPKTLASLAGVAESNQDSDEGRPDGAEKDETGPDQCQDHLKASWNRPEVREESAP